MKLSRTLAATGAIAVVVASVLFSTGAANAADGLANVEYVTDIPAASEFDSETGIPQNWTAYSTTVVFPEYASTVAGLVAPGSMYFMRGVPANADFTDIGDSAALSSAPGGVIILAVSPVDPDTGGPSLPIPVIGTQQSDGSFLWTSPFAVVAEDSSLSDTVAAISDRIGVDVSLFAYGFTTSDFATGAAGMVDVTTTYITWDGLTSMFTPQPVGTIPATVTLTAAHTGAAFSSTGFLPGESVEVYLSTADTGGHVADVIADANGVVTFTLADPTLTLGDYTLVFAGSLPNFQRFTFSIVADPAVLAATGADLSTPVVAGGFLLLAGAALALVATRRRTGSLA